MGQPDGHQVGPSVPPVSCRMALTPDLMTVMLARMPLEPSFCAVRNGYRAGSRHGLKVSCPMSKAACCSGFCDEHTNCLRCDSITVISHTLVFSCRSHKALLNGNRLGCYSGIIEARYSFLKLKVLKLWLLWFCITSIVVHCGCRCPLPMILLAEEGCSTIVEVCFFTFMPSLSISCPRCYVFVLSVHASVECVSVHDRILKVCEHNILQSTCGNFTKFTSLVQIGTKRNWLDF